MSDLMFYSRSEWDVFQNNGLIRVNKKIPEVLFK